MLNIFAKQINFCNEELAEAQKNRSIEFIKKTGEPYNIPD